MAAGAARSGHRRAAALVLAACTGGGSDEAPGSAAIRATPRTALMDVPVQVSVTGLRPGSTVTVSAETTDGGGVRWSSRVDLAADANGTASLDRAPTGGSYTGAEPMGLFTTMTPDKPLEQPVLHAGRTRLPGHPEGDRGRPAARFDHRRSAGRGRGRGTGPAAGPVDRPARHPVPADRHQPAPARAARLRRLRGR